MDVRDAEESEKMQNSRMSGFPSIVSRTSLEACASAIISASWLDALMAIGTLCSNRTLPAWMPVTAQPTALSVLDPSVNTHSVLRPSWVVSHTLWFAVYDMRSSLGHGFGSMLSLVAKGSDESWRWCGAFCEWNGSARSVWELNVETIHASGEGDFPSVLCAGGCLKGMCLGGMTRCSKGVEVGRFVMGRCLVISDDMGSHGIRRAADL